MVQYRFDFEKKVTRQSETEVYIELLTVVAFQCVVGKMSNTCAPKR